MSDETIPSQVIHDCSTGEATTAPLSPEEQAARARMAAAALATRTERADALAQRAADLALVQAKAAEDPAFAALARLLSVLGA